PSSHQTVTPPSRRRDQISVTCITNLCFCAVMAITKFAFYFSLRPPPSRLSRSTLTPCARHPSIRRAARVCRAQRLPKIGPLPHRCATSSWRQCAAKAPMGINLAARYGRQAESRWSTKESPQDYTRQIISMLPKQVSFESSLHDMDDDEIDNLLTE